MEEVIENIKTCFKLQFEGKIETPQRTNCNITKPNGHILLMPSVVKSSKKLGTLDVKNLY